ncbi:MAG: ribbon-helix-helix protein, CopG family, partial [Planctomycetales bacterium]|nr:ribbon-helix-helix protein, CopG family [Planctomycetales bacterium]
MLFCPVKNITVSLDDELYRRARVAAAQSDRSVTALVREFLTAFTASSAGTGTP